MMEVETTVSLVFGGQCHQDIYRLLCHRAHVEEDLDVYTTDDYGENVYKYRELKRRSSGTINNHALGGGEQRVLHCRRRDTNVTTVWDRKCVRRCLELQIPHIDTATGRVIFVSTTHKTSTEEKLTEEEWAHAVHEDHTSHTACRRATNKHRLAFPPESFTDLFEGSVPEFTRLSIGEYTTYGGTLEARTKCNPIYYLEIENETQTEVQNIEHRMLRLVEILFTILPYEVVAKAVRKYASATIERERVDCVFDEFKRRFVNYHRYRDTLWYVVGRYENPSLATEVKGDNIVMTKVVGGYSDLKLFIMPKWDGTKATASYCDGFLFIRDSCGSLSTYKADLPFDNDLILQLELLDDAETKERLLVVTEILAVVVKNHNTLYHVYNRNNTLHDTGRNAGNVSTSITLKTQFSDPNDICNPYRLVVPVYSLLVIHHLSTTRWNRQTVRNEERDSKDQNRLMGARHTPTTVVTAENTYMRSDRPTLLITTVVVTSMKSQIRDVLRQLDRFHNYRKGGELLPPEDVQGERLNKSQCIERLAGYLPVPLLNDQRFHRHCEGLLVAFTTNSGISGSGVSVLNHSTDRHHYHTLPDHGYLKIKYIDTVDLEYCVSFGLATTASSKYYFRVQNLPQHFPGWAERSCPVTDDRVIIECFYDRDARCLVFLKDRPDKNKADSEEKISAINREIIEMCAVRDIDRSRLHRLTENKCYKDM